jgi:MinD-like ATPase involved in chromosome partitioning or flagellar assembly
VLNKVEANGGVDVDQVLRLFPQVEQGSWMALPYAHEVTRSLNNGTPLLSYLPRLEISKDLARGFDTLLHLQEGRAEGDETKAHARGVSRILRRVPKQEAG